MKASSFQFYNMKIQISQHCKIIKTLPSFYNRKTEYRAYKQQSFKQAKLSDSRMKS